jgi:hypothetical protein
MTIRRILLFVLLFASLAVYGQSKNPGFMGKKFIVKLNLINGIRPLFLGGEIEYTVQRNFSIGIGAGYLTSDYRQTFFREYYYDDGSAISTQDYYYYRREITSPLTKMNSTSFYLQCKYYAFNKVNPAPDGLYFAAKVGLGFTNIESQTGRQIDVKLGSPAATSFTAKGVLFDFYELGFGYQKIIAKRFVIDATASFNLTNLNPGGSAESRKYTSTLVPDFGPNTLWIYPSQYAPKGAGQKYAGFNYEVEQYKPVNYAWNAGLSLYFKIGILL